MFGSNLMDKTQENVFCDGKMKLKMNGYHAGKIPSSFKKVFHMLKILKYLKCVCDIQYEVCVRSWYCIFTKRRVFHFSQMYVSRLLREIAIKLNFLLNMSVENIDGNDVI